MKSKIFQSKRIPSLDGMRAVSILLVLGGHSRFTLTLDGQVGRLLSPLLGNSSLGVAMFFVISGFLITALLVKEAEEEGTISLKQFYIRRIFRIMPAYYCFLAVMVLLAAAGIIQLHHRDTACAFLFVYNYLPFHDWWLAHCWSLSVEEQFYLLWPLTLVLFGKRRCSYIALGLIAFTPVVRMLNYVLIPGMRGLIPSMLHTRIDCLMFGCATALLYDSPAFQRFLQACFSQKAHVFAIIYLFLISPYLTATFASKYLASVGYTLEGFCTVLIMVWLIQNSRTLLGRLANSRPVVHLGVISYSLYLWQEPFLTRQNETFSGQFPLNLLCGLVVAEVSYRLVEQPCLKLRRVLFPAGGEVVRPVLAGSPSPVLSVPRRASELVPAMETPVGALPSMGSSGKRE